MPPIEIRVILRPDVPRHRGGGFKPTTFHHVLQSQIELTGLDNRWIHTLIGAEVAADGESAELRIHSEPRAGINLTSGFRILNGTPPAAVRALLPDGTVLAEARLPAPLTAGQNVEIGPDAYTVVRTDWPHRDERGVCHGDLDWQHVEVHPARPVSPIPVSTVTTVDPRSPAGRHDGRRRQIGQ